MSLVSHSRVPHSRVLHSRVSYRIVLCHIVLYRIVTLHHVVSTFKKLKIRRFLFLCGFVKHL